MSVFNPDQFLNTTYEGALDTTLIPVPETDEGWTAVVEKFEVKTTPKGQVVCELTWAIDEFEVQQQTGRDKNTVKQALWLDITDHGTLDMGKGKNVALGRLREALNQNTPGKPWSFGMLVGQVAKVAVKHRITDTGDTFADVKRVLPA